MVGETFYLSDGERDLLLSANIGEGLFFAGQSHVAIKVMAAPFEHELITSNPAETMKQEAEAKAALQPLQPLTQVTPPAPEVTDEAVVVTSPDQNKQTPTSAYPAGTDPLASMQNQIERTTPPQQPQITVSPDFITRPVAQNIQQQVAQQAQMTSQDTSTMPQPSTALSNPQTPHQ